MISIRRAAGLGLISMVLGQAGGCASGPEAAHHTLAVGGDSFVVDGVPTKIICGEMHYPRIPREYWRDRLRKARAMGLNTVATYVFWNVHEPSPGEFNFSGNADVAEFVRTAQEEGLMVMLRPGPYVCAEWEFGGYPYWLMSIDGIKVRTTDPKFTALAARFMKRLGRELAPLQASRGGPIVFVQVENEYGSFGKDRAFMEATRDAVREAGFDVPLVTADGPDQTKNAYLPGAMPMVNGGNPRSTTRATKGVGYAGPQMVGEFYPGWLDHWGAKFERREVESIARQADALLGAGISLNIYVVHGGTNFGFTTGANMGKTYEPDITSYDYDAPIDEAGHATPKYHALKAVFQKYQPPGTVLPQVPADLPTMEVPALTLKPAAFLRSVEGQAEHTTSPLTFEQLGQEGGYVLYEATIANVHDAELKLPVVHDFATVMVEGRVLGTVDRRLGDGGTVLIPGETGIRRLEVLVENGGRINYGPFLGRDPKGLMGEVTLGGVPVVGWTSRRMPMTHVPSGGAQVPAVMGPGVYAGHFNASATADTFLDLRGWTKGAVWVNGHNLGRYWNVGPQQTLYVPGVWLQRGRNDVTVVEIVAPRGDRTLRGLSAPILDELMR